MVRNKKAHLMYEFVWKLEVGIVLTGDEVKSIRIGSPSITESYAFIKKGELFLKNLTLSRAKCECRDKKLLLHKKEILKIVSLLSQNNYIIVPIEMYRKQRYFKLLLGIGKKLKLYDQRRKIEEKEMNKKIRNTIQIYI